MTEEKTVYFEKPGRENSPAALSLALECAKRLGVKNIVLASSTGATAMLLPDTGDINVSVIHTTYKEGKCRMSDENRLALSARGFHVFTAGHALSGAERSISGAFGGAYPVEIMAHTLRMLGQGLKVAVECAVMAVDAGFVKEGESIVSIGGTGGGADTAIVLRPAPSANILQTKIDRVICKPIV